MERWYEVRSDDPKVKEWLAHECGELGCDQPDMSPQRYGLLTGARRAAQECIDEFPAARLQIVRVTITRDLVERVNGPGEAGP